MPQINLDFLPVSYWEDASPLAAYEERRQDGSAEWTREYVAEHEALRRLAVVESECDESQLEE